MASPTPRSAKAAHDTVRSVTDFFMEISKISVQPNRFIMYRGQPDESWQIKPSILRGGTKLLDAEKDISREIISRFPSEFDDDSTMFDRLCRMQHFGISTRLLDVTTNSLIALYFASDPEIPRNGEVIYFDIPIDRRKYFDSDAVSCISNLANLSAEEKNILANSTARTIKEFNDLKPARRLLHFIRNEKPYFEPEIHREDLHKPYIVIPKLRNKRIIAQHGAFMIFGLNTKLGPKYNKTISTWTIPVSQEHKVSIRKELSLLGFNSGVLFPEIDKAADHIMDRFRGN